MRNRILYLTRNTIPYVRELQPLTGSVAGCLLMQQLDYWFERYQAGFWKFLEPCDHANYKNGGSWCEELGMTRHEFHTAFDRIGVRHKSKGIFDKLQDKFSGKYYCSYQDRSRNLTFYFRNHDLLDAALDSLIQNKDQENTPHPPVKPESGFTVTPNSGSTVNQQTGFTGKPETSSTEIHNSALQESRTPDLLNTEITGSDIKQIPLLLPTDPVQPADTASCSGVFDLIYPQGLSPDEQKAVKRMVLIGEIPSVLQQQLLDELTGAIQIRKIKRGIVPFTYGLIEAAKAGRFTPSLGVAVLVARKNASEVQAKESLAKAAFKIDPQSIKYQKGKGMMRSLPTGPDHIS